MSLIVIALILSLFVGWPATVLVILGIGCLELLVEVIWFFAILALN